MLTVTWISATFAAPHPDDPDTGTRSRRQANRVRA